jgi:hypothetical protein
MNKLFTDETLDGFNHEAFAMSFTDGQFEEIRMESSSSSDESSSE